MRARALWLLAPAALMLAVPSAAPAAGSGPGCAPGRPAVAHYGGGVVVQPQPRGGPVPCGMATGYAGEESAIVVSNRGSVFYAPAVRYELGFGASQFGGSDSEFARTRDLGRTWQLAGAISDVPGLTGWGQIDDKFYMDRATGRIWWGDPTLPSQAIVWSDDDGVTWNHSFLPVGYAAEWTQVTTAKPRTSTTTGYPSVVYACGEYDSIGRHGDLCQKSTDGGNTWIFAGQGLFGTCEDDQLAHGCVPVGAHAECNGQTEHANFSPWAAPDPQGRLFELLFCAGKTFLIRSDDEGRTWPISSRVPYDLPNAGPNSEGSAELRSDAEGNLYLAWSLAGNPNRNGGYKPGGVVMAVSRDHGKTWTRPVGVLAPGVEGISTHFGFDVAAPGEVALSYLGHRNGRAGFDGYITETRDALSPEPVFWSAMVNDPAQPVLDNGNAGCCNNLGLDYVSAAIGPDGTPWASFYDACAEDQPESHDPACPASRNDPNTTVRGFGGYAGRLAPGAAGSGPAAAPVSTCARRPRFTFRIHEPHARGRIVAVTAYIDGRRVQRVRGRRVTRLVLRRPARKHTFTVRIVALSSSGRRTVSVRRYRRCTKSRPRTRVHRHRSRPR